MGIRFCLPAIPHGRERFGFHTKVVEDEVLATPTEASQSPEAPAPQEVDGSQETLVSQEAVGSENTAQES